MKIGNVYLNNNLIMAPMAGITDIAFRLICKEYGAGLVYTEMVNSEAIVRNNKATFKKMKICKDEKPVVVQLFGAKINSIIKSAKIIEEMGADIIDFNLGCPDPKVIRQGAGAILLKRPTKIKDIISGIVEAVNIPVTVKMRLGIYDKRNFLKTAKIIEEAGASAIAVHGRTAQQGYSGKADWDAIKEIKENVSIPVIGNGDISSSSDAKKMLNHTKCDFVMVGRAAMTNPPLFREIDNYLKSGIIKKINHKEKIELFFKYLKFAEEHNCYDFVSAKRHLLNFTRGIPVSAELRRKICKVKELNELKNVVKEFENKYF